MTSKEYFCCRFSHTPLALSEQIREVQFIGQFFGYVLFLHGLGKSNVNVEGYGEVNRNIFSTASAILRDVPVDLQNKPKPKPIR